MLNKFKSIIRLVKSLDVDKVNALAQKIDFNEALSALDKLDDKQLKQMMKMLKGGDENNELPWIDGDFYNLHSTLPLEDRKVQMQVRDFMHQEVAPIINDYWRKDEFPKELIPKLAELDICGLTYQGYGCPGKSFLLEGFVAMEMAKTDTSISTFFGVQSGLCMGSIYLLGSEEQKEYWLPKLQKFEKIGAFGLTEPKVGSAVAGGLTTTVKKEGDSWILNGQKKWIGNATFSDIVIIYARDLDDGHVKGFIVETDTPGFKAEKIKDKMALRVVQNATITMENCKVPDSAKLEKANSFKDLAAVLRMTRASVAWQAVGCARGAYEYAVQYTHDRKQFGKSISSFQLIQDHLVTMLSNLTAMQNMCYRLSKMQDNGELKDEHASLAKVFCTLRTRDIVSTAREVMGGNGILLEYNVARFVADAEAIYSYEGTKEINSLIVGRAITGKSAFI
ncbi:acyl-CoA dehydrogenase family protein [Mangrovivirga cuniculi]|uniref:Acyl-CoA dehydrogenase n=1 Tax=Mangrovivirga cuniculi TaxID=2715131 RepID=A0A4D7JP54_9BACT|nr:acyl-CoA dehydrogenase family protein [Mangrovivirga cuniculi]QCK16437.1 acyl-CoA dehydrogenase [Mangrovivirga cuniculi]